MHFVFPSVLAFVAFVAAQSADPSISTPAQLVTCQPAQITWTSTKTPVFVSIIPGGQVGAAALEDFGQQTGTTLTWKVDIAANTQITFQIRDSSGVTAYSAPVSIQAGSDTSCVGQGSSSSAAGGSSTAAGPSSTAPVPSSVSASVSSVASSAASSASSSFEASTSSVVASASSVIESATSTRPTSSASSTRSASATSASASASASPNAARSNAQVGFAGLLGLVAAAFMA